MKLPNVTVISIWLLIINGGLAHHLAHQSPTSLEAEEGTTVSLNCSFDPPRMPPSLVAFRWHLPEGKVYRLVPGGRMRGKACQRLALDADLRTRSMTLWISNANASDSGRYVCFIQILKPLPIIELEGSGTQLRIVPGSVTLPGTKEPKVITDLSGDVTLPGTNKPKLSTDLSGNVTHPGTNESKVLHEVKAIAMVQWAVESAENCVTSCGLIC
ncbi:uncharacterized protein LOC121272241 [Carcharodon carcharias]|uniref:uncharacterized protein LOC121272241 n=1 Tax=Carcharodon carcharias TaxID=13397 RepID=UPI001B7F2A56|nr:uncharacterized protein LOC121272241 [Carcharodon carcharias]